MSASVRRCAPRLHAVSHAPAPAADASMQSVTALMTDSLDQVLPAGGTYLVPMLPRLIPRVSPTESAAPGVDPGAAPRTPIRQHMRQKVVPKMGTKKRGAGN